MYTYEISKGIFVTQQLIIKERPMRDSYPNLELSQNSSFRSARTYKDTSYAFKVDVKSLQIAEITFDFSESDSLILEKHEGLTCTTTIQPFSSAIAAVLKLGKGWKLKYQITVNIKSAPIEKQWKFIKPQYERIKSELEINASSLYKIPYEILPLENIYLQTLKYNSQFIDPEFPPTNASIYGNTTNQFDFIPHWRRTNEIANPNNKLSYVIPDYITSRNICEGIVGRYLVSAITTIAEFPPLVSPIIRWRSYSFQKKRR